MPQFEPFHRALKGDDQKLPFLINAVTQQHPPRKSCSTNSLSVFRSSITEDGVAGPKLIGTIGIFNLAGRLRFKSVGEVADEDEGEQSEQVWISPLGGGFERRCTRNGDNGEEEEVAAAEEGERVRVRVRASAAAALQRRDEETESLDGEEEKTGELIATVQDISLTFEFQIKRSI
nr:hypothetical protein Iba_chr08bCG9180 [Ipomoea batatas]